VSVTAVRHGLALRVATHLSAIRVATHLSAIRVATLVRSPSRDTLVRYPSRDILVRSPSRDTCPLSESRQAACGPLSMTSLYGACVCAVLAARRTRRAWRLWSVGLRPYTIDYGLWSTTDHVVGGWVHKVDVCVLCSRRAVHGVRRRPSTACDMPMA
jgi:hypothetical protein